MRTRRTRGAAALAGAALAVALVPMVSAPGAAAAADDLFFSEYVEGSSNNKALEIANETGATIDLGAQGVNVQMYFNGSSSAGLTIQLTGTVADGDVYVLAQSSAVSDILGVADQTNGAGWFNGDDAVVLRRGSTVLDVIGQIGSDPGSEWGSGDTSTQDNTLRRLASVCAGDTDGSDAFDPAAEWAGFAQNTFDGLGAHVSDCGDGGADLPVINEFVADHTGSDVYEFVEVLGDPDTDLGDHTILEIEGDGSGAGTIDEVITVGTTDGAGFWDTGFLSNAIENGTITLLLVEGFSGAFGDDLDTDNDGTLDVTPWTAVVDAVGVDEGGFVYGVPGLGPNYDGLSSFAPGGASRIPDGVDTDTAADWLRNDFDLAGIGDITGTPVEGEALNTPGAPNEAYEPPPGGVCGDPATAIHDIQGSGFTFDPAFGGVQSVEGVITQLAPGLNGLYVQEDDADQDGDPATSEGIFVFLGSDPASTLATGDVVRVTGTVGEYVTSGGASSQTQLTGGPIVTPCDATGTVTPTEASFPLTDRGDLERFEGMLVELGQELVISEYFNFDRFGEVVVSLPPDGWDRLYTPTAVVAPGDEATALADEYALRRITIDDVRSNQNPVPAIHPGNGEDLAPDNIFRGGDTITGIQGVIDDTFGLYRVQPTTYGEFEVVNPRR
jgi:predicted extracellular nuclease